MANVPAGAFNDETFVKTVQHLAQEHHFQPGIRRVKTEHRDVFLDHIIKEDAEGGRFVPAGRGYIVTLLPIRIPRG